MDPALDDCDQIVGNVRPDGTQFATLEVPGMLVASNGKRSENTTLGNSKIGQAKHLFSC